LAASLAVVAVGVLVMAGWSLKIPALMSDLPGIKPMKFNTAVALALAGVSLALLNAKPSHPKVRLIAQACALGAAFAGLTMLSEYLFGWTLGVDELFWNNRHQAGTFHPGRMVPASAFDFLLLGVALMTLDTRRGRALAQWLALIAGITAAFPVAGYAYDFKSLYTIGFYESMTIHTAVAFVLLSAGILAARADSGIVAVAMRNSVAVGFGLALIILLVVAAGAYHVTGQFIKANEWVAHTLKVNEAITEAFSNVQDMQSAERGYVITADETLLEPYHAAVATTNEQLKKLRSLAADDPSQRDTVAKLETLVAKEIAWTKEVIVMRRDRDREAATEKVVSGMGTRIVDEIRSVVTTMRTEEDALLRARTAAARKREVQTVLGLGVGFAVSALILLITFHFLRCENIERRQASMERDHIFTLSPDMLCTVGFDGYFKRVNPSFERTLGYAKQELLAEPSLNFVHPDDRAVTVAEAATLARGAVTRQFENRYRCKDGSYKLLQWNTTSVPPNQLLYAAIRDITERKRAEEEIRKLNAELHQRTRQHTAELEATNKELEAFCYSVSHDLRAPLRTIDGFSMALLEDYAGKLDETGRDHLQRVRAAAQHMGELIDDLLNLSRLSRGDIHRESVDLTQMAKTVVAELRERDPQRQVEVAIADGLVAQGDSHLLRVVLDNLLGNAWKFTTKQPHARIEFGSGGGNGDREFFVRDNGAGFDMTYADKLFGAFQRLHSATEFSGTGVGLATVQRIVHRHGGQVRAEAEINKGATFYFTLS